MRIRAVVVVLILLMFIICTTSMSEAAKKNKYNFHDLAYPNEHPWQHDGSPDSPDSLDTNPFNIVIMPLSPGIGTILSFRIHIGVLPGEKAENTVASERKEHHFGGSR
jgi:hypothetical protein